MSKKILVSKCLLGEACRWHGKKCYKSTFVKRFEEANPDTEIIGVCPELMGGLTVPREPVKRRGGRVFITCADKANRKNVTGKELTKEFEIGAKMCLDIAIANNIKKAILCKYSPSCDEKGITGTLLKSNNIEVVNTF